MSKAKVKIRALKQLGMSDVWEPGTADFADWLRESLPTIGEVLGMDLECAHVEPHPQSPPPEVCAFDVNGDRRVLLHTCFGETDDALLGEMLAITAGQDPMVVVLIAETISDEHREALDWLNRKSDSHTEFFGIEIEILGFGEEAASPLFRPVVTPYGWEKTGRKIVPGAEVTERGYQSFWRGIIDILVEKQFICNRAAWDRRAFAVSTGTSGVQYYVAFDEPAGQVHLGLHIHQPSAEQTKLVFDQLRERKAEIESDLSGFEVSEPLEWNEFDNLGAFWIGVSHAGTINLDADALKRLQIWVIERLVKVKYVFDKYVQDINVPPPAVAVDDMDGIVEIQP
jgi:hypothetical protein